MGFELRHEAQLSGSAEKIKKAAQLTPGFQLQNAWGQRSQYLQKSRGKIAAAR